LVVVGKSREKTEGWLWSVLLSHPSAMKLRKDGAPSFICCGVSRFVSCGVPGFIQRGAGMLVDDRCRVDAKRFCRFNFV
jgi:hypothetical protein